MPEKFRRQVILTIRHTPITRPFAASLSSCSPTGTERITTEVALRRDETRHTIAESSGARLHARIRVLVLMASPSRATPCNGAPELASKSWSELPTRARTVRPDATPKHACLSDDPTPTGTPTGTPTAAPLVALRMQICCRSRLSLRWQLRRSDDSCSSSATLTRPPSTSPPESRTASRPLARGRGGTHGAQSVTCFETPAASPPKRASDVLSAPPAAAGPECCPGFSCCQSTDNPSSSPHSSLPAEKHRQLGDREGKEPFPASPTRCGGEAPPTPRSHHTHTLPLEVAAAAVGCNRRGLSALATSGASAPRSVHMLCAVLRSKTTSSRSRFAAHSWLSASKHIVLTCGCEEPAGAAVGMDGSARPSVSRLMT